MAESSETTATETTETVTPDSTQVEASTTTEAPTDTATLIGKAGETGTEEKEAAPEYVPFTADDFQLPEGFDFADDRRGATVDFINKYQLPPEAVKEFLELNSGWSVADVTAREAAQAEAQAKAWEATHSAWVEQIKADPQIGGDKLQATTSDIADLLLTFTLDENDQPNKAAETELREAFNLTGAGNHPAIVKFLARIANTTLVKEGGPHPSSDGSESDRPRGLYPSLPI